MDEMTGGAALGAAPPDVPRAAIRAPSDPAARFPNRMLWRRPLAAPQLHSGTRPMWLGRNRYNQTTPTGYKTHR